MLLSGLVFALADTALGSLLFGGWEVCVLAGKAGAEVPQARSGEGAQASG